MLEKIDLEKKMTKEDFKEKMEVLEIKAGKLQRECREAGIPIMIIFEGFRAAGKGNLINQLIRPLDPRGFQVFTTVPTKEDELHPYFWRFFTKTPPKGRIHLFDESWYQGLLSKTPVVSYDEVNQFEKQFTDDGNVIIKLFLCISKKEQKKRLEALEKEKASKWRVSKEDWKENKAYEEWLSAYDNMIVHTDTPYAPWTVVEAMNREYASCKILSTLISYMETALAKKKEGKVCEEPVNDFEPEGFDNGVLAGVELDKVLTREEYKEKRKNLQKRLSVLHNKIYKKRVPVVLAFEGWDAGGKGGAIKRLTECLDPRGYEVVPVASPNDIEKAHHYLWRFWERMPKAGHITIFDRTWYGRVLVERIEGFASKAEWKRAYKEINDMEEHLAKSGCIVLKFWMHIDKDEQEKRFTLRQETPEKQWKITEEDWRNRAKWDDYEKAVDEMVLRTSTDYAPWIIVEANDKLYARFKVLETVVEKLEEVLL